MYIRYLIVLILLAVSDATADDIRFRTLLPYGDVLEDGKVLPKDHYMGSVDAPVIMIEYASFSCIHCATFSKSILSLIKEKYIDTGKLLFVFRDFPLDEPALKAGMLAQCYASNKHCNDKSCEGINYDYFVMYHALFHSLENWAFTGNFINKLKEVVKIGKMDSDRFYKCIKDQEIQEQIVNSKIYAIRNLGINATPIFIINSRKYEGIHNFEFFSKIFDEIIRVSADGKGKRIMS